MRSGVRATLVALTLGIHGAAAQDAPAIAADAPPILVIDREAVILRSRIGRARLDELAEAEGALAAENRQIEADLTTEESDLAAKRSGMEPGAFREAADAFDKRVTAIRDAQDAKERMLIERRQRLFDAFRQDMLPILGEIMEERQATVMMDRDAILIFAASADITDEVVRRLDARGQDQAEDGVRHTEGSDDADDAAPEAAPLPDTAPADAAGSD